MKTYLYKLHFISPLSISSDPLSLERVEPMIHSDTLFSAIANSYAMLFDVADDFFLNPPFLISSAFPFYEDILFIKTPLLKWSIDEEEREKYRKEIKNTQFISIEMFKKIVNHKKINLEQGVFLPGGFFLEKLIPSERIFDMLERPHSSVSNTNNKTNIFYTSNVHFAEKAGLYFFVKFDKEEIRRRFEGALYLLSDMGIGGNRSVGNGTFRKPDAEIFENPFEKGEYFVSLSLYHPTKEEIKANILENAHFFLANRQNWVSSNGLPYPVRSKSVRMFTEGSVFKNTIDAKGDIVDTTPSLPEKIGKLPHKIYRYGKLFKFLLSEKAFAEVQDE